MTAGALAPSVGYGDAVAMLASLEHLPEDLALLLDAELDAIEASEDWHRLDAEMRASGEGL